MSAFSQEVPSVIAIPIKGKLIINERVDVTRAGTDEQHGVMCRNYQTQEAIRSRLFHAPILEFDAITLIVVKNNILFGVRVIRIGNVSP